MIKILRGQPTSDTTSALYAGAGILAPGKSITYTVTFSQPDAYVNILLSLTGGALDEAFLVNFFQAVLDGTGVATVELGIEDLGALNQAFNQIPDLTAALNDFFHLNVFGGTKKLLAFLGNQTEVDTLATLLDQLGGDLLEEAVIARLKDPGAFASLLLEFVSNINTAFFGNTTGSVLLTAH